MLLFFPLLIAAAGWVGAHAAAIGAAATVAGVGISASQGSKQVHAQNRIAGIQQKQADLSQARQRRDAVRQTRMAYAQSQQTAENQGVAGSSASQGGLGSIISQGNSDISFLDQSKVLADQGSVQIGKMRDAEYKGSVGGTLVKAGMFGINNEDVILERTQRLQKLFGGA